MSKVNERRGEEVGDRIQTRRCLAPLYREAWEQQHPPPTEKVSRRLPLAQAALVTESPLTSVCPLKPASSAALRGAGHVRGRHRVPHIGGACCAALIGAAATSQDVTACLLHIFSVANSQEIQKGRLHFSRP